MEEAIGFGLDNKKWMEMVPVTLNSGVKPMCWGEICLSSFLLQFWIVASLRPPANLQLSYSIGKKQTFVI